MGPKLQRGWRTWLTVRLAALATLCGLALVFDVGAANANTRVGAHAAAEAADYSITFAALSCPSYSDVFANRARNDIQESLEDLGPNTQYATGELVSPEAESKGLQGSACTPLTGWQFTMGNGYVTRAVSGVWGSLSKVTNPFATSVVTTASTPELDVNGNAIAGKTVAGAVTVTLTSAEAQLGSTGNLWVQGGTPTDPVLTNEFNFGNVDEPQYGFAALRCATDAVNGDNVEYVRFSTGVHHVFCYGIYVTPPPTSGTVIVKKTVVGAPAGTNPAFPYNSDALYAPHAGDCVTSESHASCDISYNPAGFTLKNGGSDTFYRGAGQWTIVEGDVSDYTRTAISCSSQNGKSSTSTDVGSGVAQVQLQAGDTVTCTYTNTYTPPVGLTIMKQTTGGVGSFGFTVTPVAGGNAHTLTATTTEAGVPVAASGSPLSLAAGRYRIDESAPASDQGSWSTVSVDCNGTTSDRASVEVTLTAGQPMVCTYTNQLTPYGSITLRKISYGALGTFGFMVEPAGAAATQFSQLATTETEGIAATAKPASGSAPLTHLPLGSYVLTESSPSATNGVWELQTVQCNGTVLPFDQGEAKLTLTAATPHQDCTVTNQFEPEVTPPVVPPVVPPIVPDIITDLKITKTASPHVVDRGKPVTYRITVSNSGPDDAENVVVTDRSGLPPYVLRIDNPTGLHCRVGRDIVCDLGTLAAHHSVTLTLVLSSYAWEGTVTNRAVVGTSTAEASLQDNVATATVRVIKTAVSLGYLRG